MRLTRCLTWVLSKISRRFYGRHLPRTTDSVFFCDDTQVTNEDCPSSFMKKPEMIGIKSKELTVPSTRAVLHGSYKTTRSSVCSAACWTSSRRNWPIVFVRTKRRVDEIAEALKKRGGTPRKEFMATSPQSMRGYCDEAIQGEGIIDTLVGH